MRNLVALFALAVSALMTACGVGSEEDADSSMRHRYYGKCETISGFVYSGSEAKASLGEPCDEKRGTMLTLQYCVDPCGETPAGVVLYCPAGVCSKTCTVLDVVVSDDDSIKSCGIRID
jgi:hypothetical protein